MLAQTSDGCFAASVSFKRVPLPLHTSLLPLSPPATSQAAMMYAATPEAPKSRHFYLDTLASFFVPSASNKRPSLGSVDKIRHPRDRSKKPTAGHRRRLAADLYLLCQCAQDSAVWTSFSAALIARAACWTPERVERNVEKER